MEYPIIDILANAYIKNNWNGLNLIYGKNLLNPDIFLEAGFTKSNNIYSGTSQQLKDHFAVTLEPGQYSIQLNYKGSVSNRAGYFRFKYSDNTVDYPVSLSSTTTRHYSGTSNPDKICIGVDFLYSNNVTIEFSDFQIEKGSVTSYEPYTVPIPDTRFIYKLPIIKCFPLYEALNHATEGTQTDNDIQILRHYLTPLGIGGI